jgi:hypothetical protein
MLNRVRCYWRRALIIRSYCAKMMINWNTFYQMCVNWRDWGIPQHQNPHCGYLGDLWPQVGSLDLSNAKASELLRRDIWLMLCGGGGGFSDKCWLTVAATPRIVIVIVVMRVRGQQCQVRCHWPVACCQYVTMQIPRVTSWFEINLCCFVMMI